MPFLTAKQVAFYHEHGFLVVESILTPDEVDRLAAIYDRLFEAKVGREEGNQFDLAGTDEEGVEARLPQILGPSNYAPEMREFSCYANAQEIAQDLLGPEASAGGDHAIFKPAQIGAETPWHQDEAYWDPSMDYESMSIWIPLQEATIENGCMWFVPYSHKGEVLPHHTIDHDPRIHGLEVDEADLCEAVACPLPAGGATIHHNRTLHYTGPNVSNVDRRALILGAGKTAKPRGDGRRFPWNEAKRTARDERAKAAKGS
jgi:ectoine hydroxylase-related dioxygenase (phytanoyl-CoA dioxygenase family)